MSRVFSERHPIVVALLATVAFLLGIILVSAVGARAGTPMALEWSGAIGRAILAFIAAVLLRRIGGDGALDPSNGGPGAWLAALPVLVYVLAVYPALLNGDYRLNLDVPLLSAGVAANGFAAGVLEELVFRGIVLSALVAGPVGPRRIARGILLSSLLFSLPHALNVLTGEDRLRVFAQLLWSFLLGVVFSSLVVAYRNVWPVASRTGSAMPSST